ncbi:asparagine synthase (glutamine-hydrolyzing) [Lysobacter niabensis]|uniref:asparagine synthase (glutamine-hydrolyzing) n=1 Tax=Agrilutibacter niabensis TaxID=380628 RepID=A0ABU1VLI1_9GAMM|nr:asparagine synthase-related protein [Lysobacter niabensis]MDR7098317.1 asparagine synthase (glutamine-hydrolyzing) [Lysobacter niabensis]
MQGICGFLHLDGQPAAAAPLAAMRSALVRTAWSVHEQWQDGSAAFAGAHWASREQPHAPPLLQRDPGSGCVVAADSRLQDTAVLARKLGLSAHSGTGTDAGLILHAWLRWGGRCVEHLEGDFAFAIHDPRNAGLFCARDAMGVRPLYFHHAPGRFVAFASSAGAVLAHPDVPKTLDEGRIADFLVTQLEGIDKTSTFYREIERLPPAHSQWIDAQGSRRQRYWALQPLRPANPPKTDGEWAEAFTAVLERAVARHLEGPARIGCMLSGGLDSSSLAVVASQQLSACGGGPLPTFSAINSAMPDCPETRAVEAMLALPGFQPSIADLAGIAPIADTLRDCMLDSEEPFDGTMTLIHAQYLLAARMGVEAVMDGIDGDSLFLAGDSLARHMRRGRWGQALRNARADRRMYPDGPSTLQQLGRAMVRALVPKPALQAVRDRRKGDEVGRNIANSLIARDFANRIALGERLGTLRSQRPSVPPRDAGAESVAALQHPYVTTALERYHRVAAVHGIQPRHPFTDRQLIEFAVTLPDRQRQSDGWSKAILRRAMHDRLPEAVRMRRDKTSLGWRFNDAALSDGGRYPLREQLQAHRGVLAPYVDLAKLDAALAASTPEAFEAVGEALTLGAWLSRSG